MGNVSHMRGRIIPLIILLVGIILAGWSQNISAGFPNTVYVVPPSQTPTSEPTAITTNTTMFSDNINLTPYDYAIFETYNHSKDPWTLPFNHAGVYGSQQFFLQFGQIAEVSLESLYPVSIGNQSDKDKFPGGLEAYICENQGVNFESLDSTNWGMQRNSLKNSMRTVITFSAPKTCYYYLAIWNNSGQSTCVKINVSVK